MARLKSARDSAPRRSSGVGPVRAQLIERFRLLAERHRGRHDLEFPEPYTRIVEQLEAGEPMRFPTWQVPVVPLSGRRSGWVELLADDQVVSVDGPYRC